VDRRAFVSTVALGLLAAPLAAEGQSRRSLPTIGILCAVWCEALDLGVPLDRFPTGRVFLDALRERGHIDGETMVLDDRGAAIKSGLARVAADLVRRRVDLILADGLTAAQAATQATDRMPVLLLGVPGAVRHGLVQSLARPGGNATGLTIPFESLVRKQLELLRETIPQASRFGVLWNPGNPEHGPTVQASIQDAGRALGVDVRFLGRVRGLTTSWRRSSRQYAASASTGFSC
jgi:putative ABC transport system substrate-binding protein